MAFYHSIFGRFLGHDGTYVVAQGGIKTPALLVGPAGSEVAVAGAATVTAPTTVGTIAAGGTSTFDATAAKSYSLAAPAAGVLKRLTTTTTSTIAKTITLSAGTFTSTALTTGSSVVLNGVGQCLELIGISTAKFVVVANTGATLS